MLDSRKCLLDSIYSLGIGQKNSALVILSLHKEHSSLRHWHFDEFIWVVLDSNFSHKIKNQPFNFFSVFIENSSAEAIYEQLHRSICLDHPICSQKLPCWVKGWEKYSSLWGEIDMFCELGFYFSIHVILFQGKSGFFSKRNRSFFWLFTWYTIWKWLQIARKSLFFEKSFIYCMERCSSRSMDRTQSCEDCNPGSTPGWGIMKR